MLGSEVGQHCFCVSLIFRIFSNVEIFVITMKWKSLLSKENNGTNYLANNVPILIHSHLDITIGHNINMRGWIVNTISRYQCIAHNSNDIEGRNGYSKHSLFLTNRSKTYLQVILYLFSCH